MLNPKPDPENPKNPHPKSEMIIPPYSAIIGLLRSVRLLSKHAVMSVSIFSIPNCRHARFIKTFKYTTGVHRSSTLIFFGHGGCSLSWLQSVTSKSPCASPLHALACTRFRTHSGLEALTSQMLESLYVAPMGFLTVTDFSQGRPTSPRHLPNDLLLALAPLCRAGF